MKLPTMLGWLLRAFVLSFVMRAHAAIRVIDDYGNTVTMQKPAQRIISMSPHITELLFAAGGGNAIVGVVSYSDYPEAAKKIPQIGDSHEVDIERIVAMKPDLLVASRYGSLDKQIALLRASGVPIFFSEPRKLNDIPNNLIRLGQLLGTEKQASSAAHELQKKLADLTSSYSTLSAVRMFYQLWDKPMYTLNGKNIVNNAIEICGGINIFKELKTMAPIVAVEAILQADPEAIITTEQHSSADGGVAIWKRYPLMTAVKRNNLFMVNGDLLNRAGPRMIDGAAELCEKLDMARRKRS